MANVMNALLEPSPALKRRGSIRRRSSVSNYDEDDVSDAQLVNKGAGSRRGSFRGSALDIGQVSHSRFSVDRKGAK